MLENLILVKTYSENAEEILKSFLFVFLSVFASILTLIYYINIIKENKSNNIYYEKKSRN